MPAKKKEAAPRPTKVKPYLRVSTDDKGQDPKRQMLVIEPWAAKEGLALASAVVDEGTSATKTNPFERPMFIRACEQAVAEGCQGVVVEIGDRFCRQGWEDEGWAVVEMRRRYGLRLFTADTSLEQQAGFGGRVHRALKSEIARENMVEQGRKITVGMENAQNKGKHVGRPRKSLTPAELAFARKQSEAGWGCRRIARAISEQRGAFRVADTRAQRRLRVSHQLVFEHLTGARSQ